MGRFLKVHMKIKTLYKIRHKLTGKWKKAGSRPAWHDKNGKTWLGIGPVRLHLNLYRTPDLRDWLPEIKADIENWEVVAFEVVRTEGRSVLVSKLLEK